MESLHREAIIEILLYVDPTTYVCLKHTSRYFYEALNSEYVCRTWITVSRP